jgi:hypothetical protein
LRRATDHPRNRRRRIVRELKAGLAGEAIRRSRIGRDGLQLSAADAILRHNYRRRLDSIGGEDASRRDRPISHNQPKILTAGLVAQASAYSGEAKAAHRRGFQTYLHRHLQAPI